MNIALRFATRHSMRLGLLALLAVSGLAAAPSAQAGPIIIFACNGKPATILGSAGGGTIQGTNQNDVIVAFGGSDTIYGNGGNDTIYSGPTAWARSSSTFGHALPDSHGAGLLH